jgi:hypothetical protein
MQGCMLAMALAFSGKMENGNLNIACTGKCGPCCWESLTFLDLVLNLRHHGRMLHHHARHAGTRHLFICNYIVSCCYCFTI